MSKKEDVSKILNNMFKYVSSIDDLSRYAFKGGFILSKFVVKNLRVTSDIDMSVSSLIDFNQIINILLPYLDSLKAEGLIYKYVIKEPLVTDTINRSGGVKLYRKFSPNTPAFVFCGLDISIQDVSYGVVAMKSGLKRFSFSRMLADKIAVLYRDEFTIKRRCRDLYDIFLMDKMSLSIDYNELIFCLKKRSVNISEASILEKSLKSNPIFVKELKEKIDELLSNGERADKELVLVYNIDFKNIVTSVLYVLEVLRG